MYTRNAGGRSLYGEFFAESFLFFLTVALLFLFPSFSGADELATGTRVDSLNVRRVGRALFEPFGATAAVGDTLFVVSYTDLVLFEVSDPSEPRLVSYYPLPGEAEFVRVEGRYCYVSMREEGFFVLDRVEGYVVVSNYDPEVAVYRSYVSGDLAYLMCADSLHVVDISDPSGIELVSKYICEEYNGFEVSGVWAEGDTCYVACRYGLKVLDMSDPENPVEIGAYPHSRFNRVVTESDYAYLVDTIYLYILDISDPGDIREVGQYRVSDEYNIDEIGLYGGYVAIMTSTSTYTGGGIHFIDVSEPGEIQEVSYVPAEYVEDFSFFGDYLYISYQDGIEVVDVSDPENPEEVGFHDGEHFMKNVFVLGDYCYIADFSYYSSDDGLRILDVSDPAMPVEVGFERINGIRDVEVVLPYAYVSTESLGFLVYDVSDPGNIVKVGEMAGRDYYGRGLAVEYPYVYLAKRYGIEDGMKILDVSRPDSIVELSFYPADLAEEIVVRDTLAFIAASFYGVHIVDVSDPENPELISTIPSIDYSWDVDVEGDYLYIASGFGGIRIIDISDPENPLQVGQWVEPYNTANKVRVEYPRLYTSVGGLAILEISDPRNPEEIGYYKIPTPFGIAVDDDLIYLGTADYGLYLLTYEPAGIEGEGISGIGIRQESSLFQNYPNPFNPATSISFDVPGTEGEAVRVGLRIYDLRGRLIRTLVDTELVPGRHSVLWDGRDDSGVFVPSGVYLYRLVAGGSSSVRKMTVLR